MYILTDAFDNMITIILADAITWFCCWPWQVDTNCMKHIDEFFINSQKLKWFIFFCGMPHAKCWVLCRGSSTSKLLHTHYIGAYISQHISYMYQLFRYQVYRWYQAYRYLKHGCVGLRYRTIEKLSSCYWAVFCVSETFTSKSQGSREATFSLDEVNI